MPLIPAEQPSYFLLTDRKDVLKSGKKSSGKEKGVKL
jgi:hypothetical protein